MDERQIIEDGIKAEKEAINYYTFLISVETDGNFRRSWLHNLKEEQDHLKTLERRLNKLNGKE